MTLMTNKSSFFQHPTSHLTDCPACPISWVFFFNATTLNCWDCIASGTGEWMYEWMNERPNEHAELVERQWWGKPKYLYNNLSQCHFAHQMPHVDWVLFCNTSLVKQQYVITYWYTILQEQKTWQILTILTLSTCFYENMSIFFFFFCGSMILTEGICVCVCKTHLCSNWRHSVWRTVWVATNCCFISDIY
jgi:hypothetical protein